MRGLLFKEVASLVGSVSQWGLGWRRKRGSGVKGKAAQVAIYAVGLQAPWSNMSWYFSGGSVLSCCHHEQVVLSYEIKKNMYQQFWATCSTRHTAKGCHFQSFPTNISTNLPRSARCQTRNFGIAQWMQNGHWTQTGRAGDSFYFVSQKLVVSLEWAQNKIHNGLLPNTIPSVFLPTPPKCIFPVTLLVLN